MNKANGPVGRIKIGLGLALVAALAGCVGVGEDYGGGYYDGGYGGAVIVSEPDMYFYGGSYERGRDVQDYSHRGSESRAVAHPAVSAPASRSAPTRSTTPAPSRSGGRDTDKNR